MMYEEASLKAKALSVIPVERLRAEAKLKYDSYKSHVAAAAAADVEDSPLDVDDFLLVELLAWFKNEFFTWTNQPECQSCATNSHMRFVRSDRANREEILGMAGNVEVYE